MSRGRRERGPARGSVHRGRPPTVSLPNTKGHAVTRRVVGWISDVIRDPYIEPRPHFHQGPQATPAVCYDAHCRAPQLDIGAE
jgi:hypothetical protein